MARMLIEMLTQLYPGDTAEAIASLSDHEPLLGLGWNVDLAYNMVAEFSPRPIVDVLLKNEAGRPTDAFYSEITKHKPVVAHAIASSQCDGLMWDDIAEAMGNAYSSSADPTEASIWCLKDLMVVLPTRYESNKKPWQSDAGNGWSSTGAMPTIIEYDPLIIVEGPVASNHHAMEVVDRLKRARELVFGVGGLFREHSPLPSLPEMEALREWEAIGD